MTKQIHKLAHIIQARILAEATPPFRDITPVLRDAWASLYRWHHSGEKVWRIEDEEQPALADDLTLATAHLYAPGVCYTGPARGEWIIVARHAAGEPIYVTPDPTSGYAYSQPQLTYLTITEAGQPASGSVNLIDQPTPAALYLMPGRSENRWLTQEDIDAEEARFLRALRHWYRPPAIVV